MPINKINIGVKRYLYNTSWLFFEKVIRIFVSLVVGIWLARYLGPEQFGLFSYVQSLVGFFVVFSTLGLDNIVIRELVNKNINKNLLLGTAFGLKFIGAIFSLIALYGLVLVLPSDTETNKFLFILASVSLIHCFNVIDYYFQSKLLSRYVVLSNSFALLISSATKVVFIIYEAPLIFFVYTIVLDGVVIIIGLIFFFLKQKKSILDWKFDKDIGLSLLKDSWPFAITSIVIIIQARIDQVMIKQMLGDAPAGHYSAALRIIEALGFIPIVIKKSLMPSIINAKNISLALYHSRLVNYYRLSFLLFIMTVFPIWIYSDKAVSYLLGHEYSAAGALLAFMSWRLLFTNFGVARSVFLVNENLAKVHLIAGSIGMVVNIVLNYYLIPIYGVNGAISSTIVSFFITTFFIDLFFSKTRQNVFMIFYGMFTFYKLDYRR